MKVSNKILKKYNRLILYVLAIFLLSSCQKVNMDFLIDNENKDFYLPLDNSSASKDNDDLQDTDTQPLPIQFLNLDDNKIISDDSLNNAEQNTASSEDSAKLTTVDEAKHQEQSLDANLSSKGEEARSASTSDDNTNIDVQTMPIAQEADLKGIKGEHYDKWPDNLICQILPISDKQILKERPLNEHALQGVEVFIDAGTFSSRDNYTVSYGTEKINEKDLYIDIAKMAAYSLESLGAKVIILGNDDAKDINEFSRIFTASSHIFRELKQTYSKLTSPNPLFIQTLDQYLSKINTIILKNDDRGNMLINKSPRLFAQGSGANLEERYYLDLMARLDHIIYIQLKLSADEEGKEAGYQVSYLTNKEAYKIDQFNSQYYSNLNPNEYYPEHPTYQMYDDNKRYKLAKCLDMTMQQYCQALNNNLPKRILAWHDNYEYKDLTKEEDSRPGRHLNIPVVTLKLGNANNKFDSEALIKDVERYLISKAITHAVYKYFCQ